MESKLERSLIEGADGVLKKSFSLLFMIYDVNVIKYTMSWKRILFLTGGMSEWQTRPASMANLVRETGFGSHVNQI